MRIIYTKSAHDLKERMSEWKKSHRVFQFIRLLTKVLYFWAVIQYKIEIIEFVKSFTKYTNLKTEYNILFKFLNDVLFGNDDILLVLFIIFTLPAINVIFSFIPAFNELPPENRIFLSSSSELSYYEMCETVMNNMGYKEPYLENGYDGYILNYYSKDDILHKWKLQNWEFKIEHEKGLREVVLNLDEKRLKLPM